MVNHSKSFGSSNVPLQVTDNNVIYDKYNLYYKQNLQFLEEVTLKSF
jgi:hypothetical protein